MKSCFESCVSMNTVNKSCWRWKVEDNILKNVKYSQEWQIIMYGVTIWKIALRKKRTWIRYRPPKENRYCGWNQLTELLPLKQVIAGVMPMDIKIEAANELSQLGGQAEKLETSFIIKARSVTKWQQRCSDTNKFVEKVERRYSLS